MNDEWTTLGAVTEWLSGGTPARTNPAFWGGSIPWISASTLRQTRLSSSDQFLTTAGVAAGSKIAPAGATLVLVRGMALHRELRAGLATRPLAFNQDVKALKPLGGLEPEYLVFSLKAREKQILKLVSSAGSGTGVLATDRLKSLPIWVPSPQVQRGVCRALGDIDSLVVSLARQISKKRDVKQGMVQELLTGRTRLPGFTREWKDVTLGEHVTYLRSVALSREQLDSESPLRYLHYGDIHTRSSVLLDAKAEALPRVGKNLARKASHLRPGDLVFADASEDPAGVGKSVEVIDVPREGVVPGLHTIAARFDKAVLADGFKAWLQYIPEFRTALLRLAAGTKVLATTRVYISSISLKLPPVDEQRAIARVLRDADVEIELLERRLQSADAVKVGMMQELLAGRTRLPLGEHV